MLTRKATTAKTTIARITVATMSFFRRVGKGDALAKSAGLSLVWAGRGSIAPASGNELSLPVVSANGVMEFESEFTSS
jgi:hypothetical protein